MEIFQAVASPQCGVFRKTYAMVRDIFYNGVHVSSWWILQTCQVFLLVLPDVVDGGVIFEQMDVVLIHPSWPL